MAAKAIFYTRDVELAEKVQPYLKRIGVKVGLSPLENDYIQIIIPMRDQDKEYLVGCIKRIVDVGSEPS